MAKLLSILRLSLVSFLKDLLKYQLWLSANLSGLCVRDCSGILFKTSWSQFD